MNSNAHLGPSTVTFIAFVYKATCIGVVDITIVNVKLFPIEKREREINKFAEIANTNKIHAIDGEMESIKKIVRDESFWLNLVDNDGRVLKWENWFIEKETSWQFSSSPEKSRLFQVINKSRFPSFISRVYIINLFQYFIIFFFIPQRSQNYVYV